MILAWIAMLIGAQGGEACPRSAALRGPPLVADAVRSELDRRGISTSTESCATFEVEVASIEHGLAIAINTPGGAAIERTAPNVSMAATIIESFVREDVAQPLLEHALSEETRKPIKPLELAGDYPVRATVVEPVAPRPFAISSGLIFGTGSEASIWAGLEIRGCFRAGYFCFGGRFHYAEDLRAAGDAARIGADRTMYMLAATIDLPIVLGDFELAPSISAGHGIVSSERDVGAHDALEDAGGLRIGASVGWSWRFSRRWSVRSDLAIDHAPYARRELLGEAIGTDDHILLPGEPATIGWLRVGLELAGI